MEWRVSFDQLYNQFTSVWGYEPSPLAKRAARELPDAAKVLEIGAGEGRDTIFFASLGHHVRAVEASQAAAEAIRKKVSGRSDLGVEVVLDDVVEMRLRQNEYDLVFANMSLQFMTRGHRLELLDRIRSSVRRNGFIAITQPTVEEAAWKRLQHNREYTAGLCTLRFRGEVMNFAQVGEYRQEFAKDKIIEYWEGTVEDQGHPGYEKPHTHSIVSVIARIIARPEQETS
jgi:SAM-dependent methyltransferase